eukprot:SAG11_NODE_31540_length_291_cov_0.734375_1_plen_31_part_01
MTARIGEKTAPYQIAPPIAGLMHRIRAASAV